MTFLIPTPEQAHAGLRAMKTIITSSGPMDPVRRLALGSVQRHLLRTDYDLDALTPITPEDLATRIADDALAVQLVSAMVPLAMTRVGLDPREIETVEAFARALRVDPATLDHARKLQAERLVLLRVDVARRTLAGAGLRQLYEDQGLLGVLKNLGGLAGLWENRDVLERYRALEGYPRGSLGRELFDFYRAQKFPFPGEKHGAPEALLTHDLSHILGGYGTDFRSEGAVLAFQAGYRRSDPFSLVVFILLNAQHGLRMSAFAEPATGFITDSPDVLDEMVRAFARGTQMNVDLTDHWDFWAVMDQPVDVLRERYNIAPDT